MGINGTFNADDCKQAERTMYHPPLKYRVEYRDKFTPQGASRASDYWNYTTVKRILRNRVYLGHTVLGKTRKVNVKSKKKISIPQEDWCFTENTHEPLVTQEQFDRAEHFLGENTKSHAANRHFATVFFGGIAYCAHTAARQCAPAVRSIRVNERSIGILFVTI